MQAVLHLRRLQMLFGSAYVARLDPLKYACSVVILDVTIRSIPDK